MKDRWHLIALHQIAGVGWHTIHRLLVHGWVPGENITPFLENAQLSKTLIRRIQKKFQLSFIRHVKRTIEERRIQTITWFDSTYPKVLKEIAQPPWILYVLGDPGLLHTPCLAVVGTRMPTPYGLRMTQKFSSQLSYYGYTIVSGLANGIDTEAHRSTLEAHGKTIAVLASGVDVIYPKRNRQLYRKIFETGAIISESAPGTQPHPGLFPQRNRVISGLSLGTLVVEAAKKSGSLITANYSLEQGREVFAIPGPIDSPLSQGTLQLVQEGAKCVKEMEDILEELPSSPKIQK